MKSRLPHPHRRSPRWVLLPLLLGGRLLGQVSAGPSGPAPTAAADLAQPVPVETAPPDKAIELNPFVVSTTQDVGYLAQNDLSGTRMNTNLADLASPVTAFTQQFMEDVGVHSVDDLTEYMVNTRLNTATANNLYAASDSIGFVIRGLPATSYAVDFFPSTLRLDLYNLDRVDESRGPNSILFGIGSPGGLVNVSTKKAILNNTVGSGDLDVGSHSEVRLALDENVSIVPNKLALRVDAVLDDGNTFRTREYDEQKRYYATLGWQVWKGTRFDLEAEQGVVNKSLAWAQTGVYDGITPWLAAGGHISATANAAQSISTLSSANLYLMNTANGQFLNWKGTTASTESAINGANPWLSNFSLVPKDVTMLAGPQSYQETHYTRASAFLVHEFTPNFNIQIAVNAQKSNNPTMVPRGDILQVDTNPTLPQSGAPNPNVGMPFVDYLPVTSDSYLRAENVRATASYKLDLGIFGEHDFAALFEKNWTRTQSAQQAPYNWTNPGAGSTTFTNAANELEMRTYVNLAGPKGSLGIGDWRPYMFLPPNSLDTWTDFATQWLTDTASSTTMGFKWANRAVPTDDWFVQDSAMAVLQSHFFKNRLVTVIGYRQDREDGWYNDTSTTAAVGPAFPGYVTGEYLDLHDAAPIEVNAYNVTYSALFRVLDPLVIFYDHSRNSALPDSTAQLTNPNTGSNVPPQPHAISEDMGVKLLFGSRLNVNILYYQTSTQNQTANSNASIEGQFTDLWQALNTANIPGPGGVNALNIPDKFNRYTFSNAAQGYEVELIANPTESWRIFANFSDNINRQTNIGSISIAYFNKYQPYWAQYGSTPTPAGAAGATVAQELTAIQNQIQALYINPAGQEALYNSRYQANAVAIYEFHHGGLKGFWIGPGETFRSGEVIAENPIVNAATGAITYSAQYGSNNALTNLMFGYKSHLKGRVKNPWSVQVNINNLFDVTRILPSLATQGSLISYAVQPPISFLISTKIGF